MAEINKIENLVEATKIIDKYWPRTEIFHRQSMANSWGLDVDDDGNVIPKPDPNLWVLRDPQKESEFAAPSNYYNAFISNLPPEQISKIKKVKINYDYGFEVSFHGPDARAVTSRENGTRGGRPRCENPSPRALRDRAYRERKRQERLSITQTQT